MSKTRAALVEYWKGAEDVFFNCGLVLFDVRRPPLQIEVLSKLLFMHAGICNTLNVDTSSDFERSLQAIITCFSDAVSVINTALEIVTAHPRQFESDANNRLTGAATAITVSLDDARALTPKAVVQLTPNLLLEDLHKAHLAAYDTVDALYEHCRVRRKAAVANAKAPLPTSLQDVGLEITMWEEKVAGLLQRARQLEIENRWLGPPPQRFVWDLSTHKTYFEKILYDVDLFMDEHKEELRIKTYRLYDLFGVSPSCSPSDLAAAKGALWLKNHSDKGHDNKDMLQKIKDSIVPLFELRSVYNSLGDRLFPLWFHNHFPDKSVQLNLALFE